MRLSNYTPGVVESYDAATKLAKVRIPGLTDGAQEMPTAMLSYPIGDNGEHTDIRILAGDRVWLDFVNGDARFPIITGFRPKETDNAIDWRRMHHANMQFQADSTMKFGAGDLIEAVSGATIKLQAGGEVIIEAPTITLNGNVNISGTATVNGMLSYMSGLTGSGSATSNGKPSDETHTHSGVDSGTGTSGPVV